MNKSKMIDCSFIPYEYYLFDTDIVITYWF